MISSIIFGIAGLVIIGVLAYIFIKIFVDAIVWGDWPIVIFYGAFISLIVAAYLSSRGM